MPSTPTHDTDSLLGYGLVFAKSASGQAWEDAPDGKGIYVSAVAQAEVEDLQKETLLYKGSKAAFFDWPGKVTDLHGGPDAGDRTAITFDDENKRIVVKSLITTPATIERIKKEELKGYSVEGRRVPGKSVLEKSTGKRVTEAWSMRKLALVPDPALPISELTICKSAAVLSDVPLGEPEPDSFGDKLNKALGVKPSEPAPAATGEADDLEVYKAKYSKADRDKMAESGEALKDGSYPIKDAKDLKSAIKLRGNGDQPDKKIDAHIKRRAKALKLTDQLPDTLKSAGGLKILKYYPGGDETEDIGWGIDALRLLQMLQAREAAEDDDESTSLGFLNTAVEAVKKFIAAEGVELAAEGSGECPSCGSLCDGCNFCPSCGADMAAGTEKSATPRVRVNVAKALADLSEQLAEIKKSAGPANAFVQEDGVALATAIVGVFERTEDRIVKSSQDFQAGITAEVKKISGVVDFISKQPFPAGPLAKEPAPDAIVKQASGSPESLAALAAELLFREAAVAPNPEMRRYLTARAEKRQMKEETK